MSSRSPIALYRHVLRLHRDKLPPTKRALGDAYVKKEFRDHRSAKPEFVRGFLKAWEAYASDLERAPDAKSVGRDLPAKLVSDMSLEQKNMLAKLEREARRANKDKDKDSSL